MCYNFPMKLGDKENQSRTSQPRMVQALRRQRTILLKRSKGYLRRPNWRAILSIPPFLRNPAGRTQLVSRIRVKARQRRLQTRREMVATGALTCASLQTAYLQTLSWYAMKSRASIEIYMREFEISGGVTAGFCISPACSVMVVSKKQG